MPVLEWHEVKNLSTPTPEIEDIGCWSVWQAVQVRESSPRLNNAINLQGLGEQALTEQVVKLIYFLQDISFTAGPKSLQKFPGNPHDPHAHFWSIASLFYSPGREESLITPQPSEVHGAVLPPDEHLACVDYLYYVCAHTVSHVNPPSIILFSPERRQSFEYEHDLSPAWRFVVKNFRWANRLQAIADSYLRRILNVPEHEPIPPVSTTLYNSQMLSQLIPNSSSILPSMPVGRMILPCTATVSLRRIASPQLPFTSAASEKFRKKHASDWVLSHSTLSCSATRKIPRGGIRFVRWAGTRPTTLRKIRSTNMVDGDAHPLFTISVICFNKCAGIPSSSMLSSSPLESA